MSFQVSCVTDLYWSIYHFSVVYLYFLLSLSVMHFSGTFHQEYRTISP